MRTQFPALLLISGVGAVTGRDVLSPDIYWSGDDYELTAIDVKGRMTLAVDLHNGTPSTSWARPCLHRERMPNTLSSNNILPKMTLENLIGA